MSQNLMSQVIWLKTKKIKMVNKRLGKYEIRHTLGEGNFGKHPQTSLFVSTCFSFSVVPLTFWRVKYAINVETEKEFAIKIVDKEKIKERNLGEQIKREERALMFFFPSLSLSLSIFFRKSDIGVEDDQTQTRGPPGRSYRNTNKGFHGPWIRERWRIVWRHWFATQS